MQVILERFLKEPTGPDRPTPEEVVSVVAEAFEISPDAVPDRSHQPAFKAAVYLLRRAYDLSLREVARRAGVSPSRISRIQAELEHGEQVETIAKLFLIPVPLVQSQALTPYFAFPHSQDDQAEGQGGADYGLICRSRSLGAALCRNWM